MVKKIKKVHEFGRIQLPKGKTANERAKEFAEFKSPKTLSQASRASDLVEKQTVKLTVIGGVAEAYEVPKGVRVEVHDYDCDAIADAPDIHRDKRGDRYILKVWE